MNAVNRVNLSVADNEFIAIIGSSGSGKSTLLHLCGGLDYVDSGNITIRSNDITRMNEDELNRFRGEYIGFVFQSHHLIEGLTVLENIMLPTVMCEREEYKFQEHTKKLIDMVYADYSENNFSLLKPAEKNPISSFPPILNSLRNVEPSSNVYIEGR